MKKSLGLVVALALFGTVPHAFTQTPTPAAAATATPTAKGAGKAKPAPKAFGGKVTAVADGSITVTNPKLGDRTFKVGADTPITKTGAGKIKLEDIKVDDQVHIKIGETDDTAAHVMVADPNAKKAPAAKNEKKEKADKTPPSTPSPTPKA